MTGFEWTSNDAERVRRYLCDEMSDDERAELAREIEAGESPIGKVARRLGDEDASLITAMGRLAVAVPRTRPSAERGQARAGRRIWLAFAAALAASFVAIALWLGRPNHELIVQLSDSGRTIGMAANGNVVGLERYGPEVQDEIREALRGRLPFPGGEDYTGYSPPIVVRSDGNVEVPLVAPINTTVQSQQPVFKWKPVEGIESYVVSVTGQGGNTLTSEPIRGKEWRIDRALDRGATYDWVVNAGGESAPEKMLPGRFRVATDAEDTRAKQAEQEFGESPLTLLVTYCELGMFDLAEGQLGRLAEANPNSPLIDRLKKLLASHRQSPGDENGRNKL